LSTPITSVSFDYEIFPNGDCPVLNSTSCGGAPVAGIYPKQPDFTLTTNLGQVFRYLGVTPGSAYPAGQPGGPSTTHSPNSGAVSNELAPQAIGFTGLLTVNVAGATTFTFTDWPATIGIDKLTINTQTQTVVPEPGTILLLGSGLAGYCARRRSRKAASV
jgi:hypothetical protein